MFEKKCLCGCGATPCCCSVGCLDCDCTLSEITFLREDVKLNPNFYSEAWIRAKEAEFKEILHVKEEAFQKKANRLACELLLIGMVLLFVLWVLINKL